MTRVVEGTNHRIAQLCHRCWRTLSPILHFLTLYGGSLPSSAKHRRHNKTVETALAHENADTNEPMC